MNQKHERRAGLERRNFIKSALSGATALGFLAVRELPGQLAKTFPELKIKEYRTLGRTGFKVSDIGFGAGNLSNPDVLEAALEMGMNYIDTAEHYNRGNSERAIGEVLAKHDRKKIFLTTKLNMMMGGNSRDRIKARFGDCLGRLQTGYADCLMLHMVPTVDQVRHEDYHDAIRELKAEGKVRFTGLSTHGTEHKFGGPVKDEMDKIVLAAAEDGRFDVVLFTYNFIQREMGDRILAACKGKNMGTTLMKTNPVKFYRDLLDIETRNREQGRKMGEQFRKILEDYKALIDRGRDFIQKYGITGPARAHEAAIRFCLGNPDVHSVCPSMNSFEELNSFVALSGTRLDGEAESMLTDYGARLGRFYCRHSCGRCQDFCPQGVRVNTVMRYYHYFAAQGREKYAMEKYGMLLGGDAAACSGCARCGCEEACPYGVTIQALLMLAHQTLTLGTGISQG